MGHFTKLIIRSAHERVKHGGAKDTLTEARSRFWILQGRSAVAKVITRCAAPCNRLESRPFKSPIAPDLPESRVHCSYPFEQVGVDYLGPLFVMQVFDESNDDNLYKVHVVLFTCAVTRAVHLDLVSNLSATAFIQSLKRFIARRGVPRLFISDNATC